MGKYTFLLAIALSLVVTSEVLSSATDSNHIKNTNLASGGGDTLRSRQLGSGHNKRFLSDADAEEEGIKDASVTGEERGFWSAALAKLANLANKVKRPKTAKNRQFKSWLKEGKDPLFVRDFYGLKGLAPAVLKKHPNFELWLEYSAIWMASDARYRSFLT